MTAILARLGPVGGMGLLVLSVLAASTAAVSVMRRARMDVVELSARVRSWWTMCAVFFGALAVSRAVSWVFFSAVSALALKEYLAATQPGPADAGLRRMAYAGVVLQYAAIAAGPPGLAFLLIPVCLLLALPLQRLRTLQPAGFAVAVPRVQWGMMVFVFGLSHAALVLGRPADGTGLLLFLVIVVEASDVLQYAWGRALGRRKLFPTLSPGKTWEGLIGGIGSAAALALGIRFLTPFSLPETAGVACLVAIAGFAGGAAMSALKRDLGVKDFGALIPGHGGVIDRVDSLCFAAPVFYHWVSQVHG